MITYDAIDKAFEWLREYCKVQGAACENCRFLDEEECCIFGTIPPADWKMPEKGADNATD